MSTGPLHLVVAVVSLLTLSPRIASAVDTLRFEAIPTSAVAYVYRPSLFGLGENCVPSRYLCEFGVAGSFDYAWDRTNGIARLTNVNFQLLGNEGDKLSPLATSKGVSDWLQERVFVDQQVLGPFTQFADQFYSQLILVDNYDGILDLRGGFDHTPADGIAIDFHVRAVQVPEPTRVIGLIAVPLVAARRRRHRRGSRRDPVMHAVHNAGSPYDCGIEWNASK